MLKYKFSLRVRNSLMLLVLILTLALVGEISFILFSSPPTTLAQTCFEAANPRLNNGLLTSPSYGGGSKFGSPTGQCIVNNPNAAQLALFQIPSYDELKKEYFERVSVDYQNDYNIDKVTNPDGTCNLGVPATEGNLRFNARDKLFNFIHTPTTKCNLVLGGNPTGNRSGVVFVDGDLIVTADSMFPNNHASNAAPNQNAGVIYIVRDDVFIGRDVGIFDGIIMAGGTINTSCVGAVCLTDRTTTTKQLVIYGNLVSLNSALPIQFQRDLSLVNGNATPAEQIIADPKYLVLFHQLFARIFSVQTEDTNFAIR